MKGKKIIYGFEREENGRTQKGEFCLPCLETGRKWKYL